MSNDLPLGNNWEHQRSTARHIISCASMGGMPTTQVVRAGVSGQHICLQWFWMVGGMIGEMQWFSGVTPITGLMAVRAGVVYGGQTLFTGGLPPLVTAVGEALNLTCSANGQLEGFAATCRCDPEEVT